MKIEIRRASTGDLDRLVGLNSVVQRLHAALEPATFKAYPDPAAVAAMFERTLAGPEHHVRLAVCDGQPAGYVWFERQARPETALTLARERLYVHHLAVDPAYQRKGIGTALLNWVAAEAEALGIPHVLLDFWTANTGAGALFAAQGFEPINMTMRKTRSGGYRTRL